MPATFQLQAASIAMTLASFAGFARAQAPAPTTIAVHSTAPAVAPSTAPAAISSEAKILLDSVDAAYRNLTALTLSGTVSADIDVAGQVKNESKPFVANFQADGLKFRHETPGEVLVGSTGEKLFAYRAALKSFSQQDAPKQRLDAKDIAQPYQIILRTQNPSLLLALSAHPSQELINGATSITRAADLVLEGVAYPALIATSADGTVTTIAMDPNTHLLRRVTFDLAQVAKNRGAPGVKKALLVNDFAIATAGQPVAAETFAWAPPEDAQDEALPKGGEMADAAATLEGKPAPDFTLSADDGSDIKLSELKGSVVILDFWATWCPPCREGLPVLDALAKDRAAKGVKVLAVNVREDKDTVAAFKTKTSLGLIALFDTEGKISDLYKVTGIPQTVVIAKDGTVKKVIVGYEPEEKATLEKLLDELSR